MRNSHRDLTNYQWRVVSNAIARCSLPIFVKLVFAEICRWKSYSRAQETHLASNVMDSIMMLFERIEIQVFKLHSLIKSADGISFFMSFFFFNSTCSMEGF